MSPAVRVARRAGAAASFSLSIILALSGGAASAAQPFRPVLPILTLLLLDDSPTLQEQVDAANATVANNPACTSLGPFYWEIGGRNGKLASGTGGDNSAAPPTADTPMAVASASKWIFATYAVEKRFGMLSDADIKFLTFESGYTNFDSCPALSSIESCLLLAGANGGTNGDHSAGTDDKFYYNGGHMQVMADAMGLGALHNAGLASEIKSVLGASLNFSYIQPQPAGGIYGTAHDYAQFLQNLLNGSYRYMAPLLGSHVVCTHTNSADCATALFSPLNQSQPGPVNDVSDEAWHYSLGHWVEDDPTVGDGAFSSAGAFGFYPWIDKSKTYYGLIARLDIRDRLTTRVGKASADCGRIIRGAWNSGRAR